MDNNKSTQQRKKRSKSKESISAFKKELKALTLEPVYGENIKDIITRITAKLQQLAESYGYEIEFPERAKKDIEGDIYYFVYPIKVKTKHGYKKIYLEVEYLIYDEGRWMGIITDIK